MASKSPFIDERVMRYIHAHSLRESAPMLELRTETARLPEARMQVPPEEGQFLAFLVRAIGARQCLEIGTFTGYSALCVARALPHDGRLVCCDLSREWTDVARRYWQRAEVLDKIDLRLGPALRTLDALIAQGGADQFDFAFIDADKKGYDAYYERCLRLVRKGGIIAFDNTLWSGAVADAADRSEDTQALRALNDKLHHDERVDISLLPCGDGVTLVLRR